MRFNQAILFFVFFLCFPFISGCTVKHVSSPVIYSVGNSVNADKNLSSVSIGVKLFSDNRSWIKPFGKEGEGFYGEDPVVREFYDDKRRYGITYDNVPFIPVNELIQDVLVKELSAMGFTVSKYSSTQSYDYVIDGVVAAFQGKVERNNLSRAKMRSMATLTMSLYDSASVPLIDEKKYVYFDRKNTMWVDKAADRLVNLVLREIVKEFKVDLEVQIKESE